MFQSNTILRSQALKRLVPLAVSLLIFVFLAGCEHPNISDIEEPDDTGALGDLQLSLTRQATSSLPTQADSISIRVWHPDVGTNSVKLLPVPSVGETLRVVFSIVARSGYSIGAIAFGGIDSGYYHSLAGGRADNITVSSTVPVQVTLPIVEWEMAWSLPDTVLSGESTTVSIQITQGPIQDFLYYACLECGVSDSTNLKNLGGALGNQPFSTGTATFSYNNPTVDSISTMYYRVEVYMAKYWNAGTTMGGLPHAYFPSPVLGEALVRRPIVPPSGTLIISIPKK